MSTNDHRVFPVLIICCIFVAVATLVSAQPPQERSLRDQLYELNDTATARGDSWTAKADLFVEWMATNDWQSMEIVDLYNLYGLVNADSVDRCHFSARWTGSLTAPVSGAYTLRQVQVYHGPNCHLKVLINGQIVLDSSRDASTEGAFTSSPIQLTVGEAVPIQVEMMHDVTYINFSKGAPMVVLTWQRDGTKEAIIPTTAFTPPAEFAQAGAHGLKGEYFRAMTFEDLRLTRLDPALDLVWSWPPAASIHNEEARQVFDACTAKILDGDFLSRSVADGNLEVLEYQMWRIAFRMTATQRQKLVETLRQRPDVLAAMKPIAMGKLMQAIYMLPSDEHIDLLGEWALARPQPRCEAGQFPGWGDGYYQQLNTDYYWLMGVVMQGPYWNDAVKLYDLYSERPDGECNLVAAYAAAFAGRANATGEVILTELTDRIDDPSVQGDKLVSWLIARAFAAGIMGGQLEPMGGFSDVESAYIAAESDNHKFWALQEMVARLSSVDNGDRAKELTDENRNRFNSPDQQAAFAQWTAKADALSAFYAEERVEQKAAAQSAYLDELKRRRQTATERGDSNSASRYTDMIGQLEAVPQ